MSALQTFIYCPKCSAQALKPSSPKSIVCTECGFEFYFNPAAAVAGIIFNEKGDLLVTVRAHDPGKGQWDLPGGFIDFDETAEHALAREIEEELNLNVDSMDYMMSAPNEYHFKGLVYPTLDMAFICHISDFSNMKALDDIKQALFAPLDKIDPVRFPFPSIRAFVTELIARKMNKQGSDLI